MDARSSILDTRSVHPPIRKPQISQIHADFFSVLIWVYLSHLWAILFGCVDRVSRIEDRLGGALLTEIPEGVEDRVGSCFSSKSDHPSPEAL